MSYPSRRFSLFHNQFGLIFVIILFISLVWYGLSHWLLVGDIQIKFSQESEWEGAEEEVHSLLKLKLKKFIGRPIKQVSLDDIKREVRSEARVGEVKILRRLPNRFFIQIKSRKPLLLWLNAKEGTLHPLSMDGHILPPLPIDRIPNLPILRGDVFFKDKQVRKQAIRFMNLLPEQGEFSQKALSEIKYSVSEKSLIFILLANGKPVKMGFEIEKAKLKRVESVLRYLNQKNIKWRIIDARFAQKIVVSTLKPLS